MTNSNTTFSPLITVVIGTRNRGDGIVMPLTSIFQNTYPNFEVRVIDQSENDLTEIAVQPFLADPRFYYRRSKTKGVATGRNLAISEATSEFIAITDDDCDPPHDWLQQLAQAFSIDERIGLVFGNVVACQHDPAAGFIPDYVRTEPFLATNAWQKTQVNGIGACMGVRRSAWQALGGFDQMLGPGSPFRAYEDNDFAIRLLQSGYWIYEEPKFYTIHYGFRSWLEGRDLARRNWYGIGASHAKHIKCGHSTILPIIWHEFFGWAVADLLKNIFIKHRITAVMPVWAFMQGFVKGLLTPVNHHTCHFQPQADKAPVNTLLPSAP